MNFPQLITSKLLLFVFSFSGITDSDRVAAQKESTGRSNSAECTSVHHSGRSFGAEFR